VKKIRLYAEAYRAGHAFSVTIATHLRRPYFARPEAASIGLEALRESVSKHNANVFAYCFMPNHVHLLVRTPPQVPLTKFLDGFKQLVGFRLKRALSLNESVWQTRYFDHGLRAEEELEEVANYIWRNPVRAGLVRAPSDYPYSGSMEFPRVFSSEAEAPDLRDYETPPMVADKEVLA
jgi:putative transposase